MKYLYWLLKNNYQSTQATIIRQIAISYMRDIYGLKREVRNGEYVIIGVYQRIKDMENIYESFFKGPRCNPRMIYTENDFRDYISKEDLLHAYERNCRFM